MKVQEPMMTGKIKCSNDGKEQVTLGVTIDNKLNLSHIKKLCKKAWTNELNDSENTENFNPVVKSQLNYYALV